MIGTGLRRVEKNDKEWDEGEGGQKYQIDSDVFLKWSLQKNMISTLSRKQQVSEKKTKKSLNLQIRLLNADIFLFKVSKIIPSEQS